MGVATANSILVVSFAKDRLLVHGDAVNAALEAGTTRFRPQFIGDEVFLPRSFTWCRMMLGLGDGGEQNAPGDALLSVACSAPLSQRLSLSHRCSPCFTRTPIPLLQGHLRRPGSIHRLSGSRNHDTE